MSDYAPLTHVQITIISPQTMHLHRVFVSNKDFTEDRVGTIRKSLVFLLQLPSLLTCH